jgi:hypothetical protein
MIAWAWSVYPRLSTNPMVAAGITDEPAKARVEVESILGTDEGAAWGILQQVKMSLGDPDQEPLQAWPATGYIPVMCRRNAEGGFSWQPVVPVHA